MTIISHERRAKIPEMAAEIDRCHAVIERLEADLKALREALTFYANPEVYRPHPHGSAFDNRDLSFVARAALAASEGKQ